MEKSFTKKINTKEELKIAVSKHFEITPRVSSVLDIRYKEIQEYIENLNSGSKFHFITGFAGVGKSEILKLTPAFLDNTLFFCFDCFRTACIDDIVFSLYRYFTTIKSVKVQQLIKRTFLQTRSIDERVFDLLKDFPINLVIAFDSFEHFINKNTNRLPHEIAKFLDFLSEQENIKIVTVSQVASFELIKKYPFSKTLRLEALEYDKFLDIKKAMHVKDDKIPLEKVFEETFGIPLNVRNFFKLVKDEDSAGFFKKFSSQKLDFNDYVNYRLVGKIHTEELNVLYLLAAIRHPVTRETIESLISEEEKQIFSGLIKTPFVSNFDGQFYVKEFFARQIESRVGKSHKEKVHTTLAAFYEREIPLKHFERHIKLSRTTLRNELAYHAKLAEKKKSNEIALMASTLNTDVILFKDSQSISPYEEKDVESKSKKSNTEKILQQAENIAVQNISAHHIHTDIIGAEFTEEERKHLYEEARELHEQDEKKKPKDTKEKLLIDEIPIEVDFKKSKIINNTGYYKFLDDALTQENKKDYEKAVELYSKAQGACQNKEKEIYIHTRIAHCNTKQKKRTEAMNALKAAYTIAAEIDDNKKIAYVVLNIAKTLQAFGEYKLAEQHYNDFLDMNVLKDLPKGQLLFALLGLGDLYIDMNQEANALTVYETALKKAGVNYPALNEIYFKIALTFDNMGKIQQAKEFYERGSRAILVKEGYDKYYSESCANLGLIYSEEGDSLKAIELLTKSYETDKNAGELEFMVQSASRLADTYFDLKDYKSAQKFYYEKLKAAKELDTPYLLASAYLDVGDVYVRINNLPKALRAFVLAKKSIGGELSTDSKVKIERRIEFIKSKLGAKEFEAVLGQTK